MTWSQWQGVRRSKAKGKESFNKMEAGRKARREEDGEKEDGRRKHGNVGSWGEIRATEER